MSRVLEIFLILQPSLVQQDSFKMTQRSGFSTCIHAILGDIYFPLLCQNNKKAKQRLAIRDTTVMMLSSTSVCFEIVLS